MDNYKLMHYAARGIAATIPGYQQAIDDLQSTLDDLRGTLQRLQHGQNPVIEVRTKRGSPPKTLLAAAAAAPGKVIGGWSSDPAERSAEMKRRMALSRSRAKQESRRQSAQTRWKNSSQKERAAWLKAMEEGRRHARHLKEHKPSVKLEVAS